MRAGRNEKSSLSLNSDVALLSHSPSDLLSDQVTSQLLPSLQAPGAPGSKVSELDLPTALYKDFKA